MEMRLGKNLRYLMKKKRLTVTQISKGSGVPFATCHDAVYDRIVSKPMTIIKLSQFFSISMEELLLGDLESIDNPITQ